MMMVQQQHIIPFLLALFFLAILLSPTSGSGFLPTSSSPNYGNHHRLPRTTTNSWLMVQEQTASSSLFSLSPLYSKNDDSCTLLLQRQNGTTASSSSSSSSSSNHPSRREFWGITAAATASTMMGTTTSFPSEAGATYVPAVRPLSYRVDSTIPPTLLSIPTPSQAQGILTALARGSGTDKQAIFIDSVNLNNMLNKAVFGTINTVTSLLGAVNNNNQEASKGSKTSFCCLAVPSQPRPDDVALALEMLQLMVNARNTQSSSSRTGLGLYFCPYSTQSALTQYTQGEIDQPQLSDVLTQAGVSLATQELYLPILQFARGSSLDLIALAPEVEDMVTVRSRGLQYVNAERRSQYVMDAPGFIALPQDPRFKMYTERSLSKDFVQQQKKDENESFGNFFAERILVHEAGATAMARYAVDRLPGSFVVAIAPISDLRFLGGINGRLPRVCRALNPDSGVTENAVTTILLNPTAEDTLSQSRYLRLEIGTAPETLAYQSKVADYLWFSNSPKVNLIPRLMN